MDSKVWYSEATLTLGTSRLRAGTLIQCARRWDTESPDDGMGAVARVMRSA